MTRLPRALLRIAAAAAARVLPLSEWGSARGRPVDRYYIEGFVARHAADVRGRVLEVKEDLYASRYGRGVERVDVLDVDPANPRATIHADLAAASGIPSDTFDCFVLTQTLHLVYDVHAAVRECHRILRPGGVLLVTVPTTSRLVVGRQASVDQWRFTGSSCRRLFEDVFGPGRVEVEEHGSLVTCLAFLAGLAVEDLRKPELDRRDDRYGLVVAVRAVKEQT